MACSLLGVSYRAFNVSSVLDVAYMVPHSASQPDGLLICAMHASKAFTPSQAYSNAVVLSVEEGGSQFAQGDTRYLSLPENKIDNAPFFTPARTYNLRPVEIGTVEDVLATDARFANTFSLSRFDDFVVDAHGASLQGLVQHAEAPSQSESSFVVDANPTDGFDDTHRRGGNCALLTAKWQRGLRYRIRVNLQNPKSAEQAARESVAAWVTTLTYTKPTANTGLRFSVRGPRYGTACTASPSLADRLLLRDSCADLREVMPAMRSAVSSGGARAEDVAAVTAGELALSTASAAACEAVLNSLVGTPVNLNVSSRINLALAAPRTLPPCSTGMRRALDGTCVACAPGAGADCACPSDRPVQPVGSVACGSRRFGGANSTTESLALLCSSLSRIKDKSPASLARGAVESLLEYAPDSFDEHAIMRANATFWARYAIDPRMADNPSRRYTGLMPRCAGCDVAGEIKPGEPLADHDLRFRSIAGVRTAGLAISDAGVPCESLVGPEVMTAARAPPVEGADGGASDEFARTANPGLAEGQMRDAFGAYEDQYMCDALPSN